MPPATELLAHQQLDLRQHAAARPGTSEDEGCLRKPRCVALVAEVMQSEGDVRVTYFGLFEVILTVISALPVRPASPLPPNVPTGPRNKNKYKDIDGSAPAVDGLDYGGGKDRTTPPDYDERSSSR